MHGDGLFFLLATSQAILLHHRVAACGLHGLAPYVPHRDPDPAEFQHAAMVATLGRPITAAPELTLPLELG